MRYAISLIEPWQKPLPSIQAPCTRRHSSHWLSLSHTYGIGHLPSYYTADTTLSPHRGRHKIHIARRLISTYERYLKPTPPSSFLVLDSDYGHIMHGHLQFVTTPTSDTSGTAITLLFQEKRYFFGHIHEGLQRAGLQHSAKFLKIKEYFLTGRTEWATTGGLLGLILSNADGETGAAAARADNHKRKLEKIEQRKQADEELVRRGKKPGRSSKAPPVKLEQEEYDPTLRLWSGPNVKHTLAAARSFIFRKGMPVNVHEIEGGQDVYNSEYGRTPIFEDDRIAVWAMPVDISSRPDSSRSASTASNRKRSLGDYIGGQKAHIDEQQGHLQGGPNGDHLTADRSARDFIVKEMFQSNWRYDKLVEKPLHDVKLPATMFVKDPETKALSKYNGPLPNGSKEVPNIGVLVREPWPGQTIDHLPPTTPTSTAMSYIVKSHKQRGKFRAEEGRKFGLTSKCGFKIRGLTQGKTVQMEDGTVVTPEMVLEPSREGGGFVVVDLPSTKYLPNLFAKSELKDETLMSGINAFIWLLGPDVAQDEQFLRFIAQHNTCQHIVSSSDVCSNSASMTAAARNFRQHHLIDPDRYPSFQGSSASSSNPLHEGNTRASTDTGHYLVAAQGLKFRVVPDFHADDKHGSLNEDKNSMAIELPEEVVTSSRRVRNEIASENIQSRLSSQELPSADAEITCLGTGSMLPSLYRNVSSSLLRVPGSGTYLIDCGENTLGQLQRVYSKEELQEIFQDLKMIWLSHLHADHHLGTTAVIKAWYNAVHSDDVHTESPSSPKSDTERVKALLGGRKLFVVSNSQMAKFLHEYSSVEDIGYQHLVPLVV